MQQHTTNGKIAVADLKETGVNTCFNFAKK